MSDHLIEPNELFERAQKHEKQIRELLSKELDRINLYHWAVQRETKAEIERIAREYAHDVFEDKIKALCDRLGETELQKAVMEAVKDAIALRMGWDLDD